MQKPAPSSNFPLNTRTDINSANFTPDMFLVTALSDHELIQLLQHFGRLAPLFRRSASFVGMPLLSLQLLVTTTSGLVRDCLCACIMLEIRPI